VWRRPVRLLKGALRARRAGRRLDQDTSYGYNDNDDGNYGTAQIAYPQIHSIATEDLGTYSQPVTFATDQNEFAPGTIIYVPHLEKYFIMEDGCVECTSDWNNRIYHVDLWMGPSTRTR